MPRSTSCARRPSRCTMSLWPCCRDRSLMATTNHSSDGTLRKKGKQEVAPLPPALTPAQRVDRAIEAKEWATVDKMWELQLRIEQHEAERAFNRAMALAKADIPIIEKTKHVSFAGKSGRTEYWHEDLAE